MANPQDFLSDCATSASGACGGLKTSGWQKQNAALTARTGARITRVLLGNTPWQRKKEKQSRAKLYEVLKWCAAVIGIQQYSTRYGVLKLERYSWGVGARLSGARTHTQRGAAGSSGEAGEDDGEVRWRYHRGVPDRRQVSVPGACVAVCGLLASGERGAEMTGTNPPPPPKPGCRLSGVIRHGVVVIPGSYGLKTATWYDW